MFILPLNSNVTLVCSAIASVYEILRIVIAYILARPSDEIKKLTIEKVRY